MAVVKVNYVKVGSQAWAARISAAMTYYSRRPGDDLEHELETPAAQLRYHRTHSRDEPHAVGRDFYTSDGQKIPLAEAHDRLFTQIESRREQARHQRDAARVERKSASDRAFDERCRRFVAGEDRREGRQLSPARRQVLVDRWRQTRNARERMPDPVFRIYRVILSTERALMDGRDLREVLELAVTGAVGAAVGAGRHAGRAAYRNVASQAQRASQRGQQRAAEWMYVRHDTGSHPHIHALLLTEGRGLSTRDLDRMREALAEREMAREREQAAVRQRDDGGREQ